MNSLFENYQQFLLFLYVHIAEADLEVKISEIEVIISKMKKLFPEVSNLNKLFSEVQRHYESLSKEQVDLIIKDNFEKFSRIRNNAELIFDDLFEIIYADDVVHDLEIESIRPIKALLMKGYNE